MDTNRSDEFDTRVMKVLFDTGHELAQHGYHWFKRPPGLIAAGAADGDSRPLR